MILNSEQRQAIAAWYVANENLQKAKNDEDEARALVSDLVFDYKPDDMEAGTRNIELEDGSIIQGVFKVSTTLDSSCVSDVLQRMANSGPEGVKFANRVVSWKPSLNKKDYDLMDESLKTIFNEAITTKPAKPAFKFIPAPTKE